MNVRPRIVPEASVLSVCRARFTRFIPPPARRNIQRSQPTSSARGAALGLGACTVRTLVVEDSGLPNSRPPPSQGGETCHRQMSEPAAASSHSSEEDRPASIPGVHQPAESRLEMSDSSEEDQPLCKRQLRQPAAVSSHSSEEEDRPLCKRPVRQAQAAGAEMPGAPGAVQALCRPCAPHRPQSHSIF